ncbi:hypothetical protein AvCA_16830 [Azotobacter vinelandii CA]|uniref:Uncharacterized protein n=2 Tax=Azotobacter vinelandii TaxID=354 RepID=C1DSE1_AZOVD|nr:hypothetical protein [Azotobacter vinelandii]ACO77896.1 hypothetical protein Avin_16830 [Azotobacter vinelandii DJ]AGK15231.1 hypothetical protein AvCA_16830 [Azotobacter vinelandii CA]AGK20060.1 hypothetical protein AvCA6_16830 [Azotobacter vinelandii CA6]WKN23632.1 hypothetical protein AVAEIV_001732 [Azotobacter vinelandii]SFY29920.1 hypothetical protein SAMN04244547_04968 [Azotobacter vinelandii]
MRQINECDPCFEENEKDKAGKRGGHEDVFTRCLQVGMLLMYGTAFLGMLF